jgi:hypothetical protein
LQWQGRQWCHVSELVLRSWGDHEQGMSLQQERA